MVNEWGISTKRETRNGYNILLEDLMGRDHLGDQDVSERIILRI
jgi:hypothetical protein